MSYHKQKTPFMVSKERELMEFFLHQIKRWKGLTSIIATSGGINGKWFDPNNPYEITSTKGMRMVSIKAAFQEEDEHWYPCSPQFSIEFCKTNGLTPNRKPKSRRKQ